MKEEILGGLRNALDRGESMEKAMQTFINAGYSAAEVRDAAGMISQSATGMLYGIQPSSAPTTPTASPQNAKPKTSTAQVIANPASTSPNASPNPLSAQPFIPNTTVNTAPTGQTGIQPVQKGRKTAIILAIILIFLVLALGITLFFAETILEKFFK